MKTKKPQWSCVMGWCLCVVVKEQSTCHFTVAKPSEMPFMHFFKYYKAVATSSWFCYHSGMVNTFVLMHFLVFSFWLLLKYKCKYFKYLKTYMWNLHVYTNIKVVNDYVKVTLMREGTKSALGAVAFPPETLFYFKERTCGLRGNVYGCRQWHST